VYTPEHKRTWGYYVLPILYGDRLRGRFEPRFDRTTSTLRILGLWWEDGFDPRTADGFVAAMRRALAAYMRFGGVRAIEWAPHNVHVNAIGPTYFETPLVATLRDDPGRFRFINERTPMGRWGQPEELEGTVIFLASKASDFITGQTIYVDGGWTIW
jgi:NAD(P)-dependent dehydrogenase (short-subunit alcohol dehydrogenase family)